MKLAPSLHTHGRVSGVAAPRLFKVLSADEALFSSFPPSEVLVLNRAVEAPFAGSIWRDAAPSGGVGVSISDLRDGGAISAGDVIRITPGSSLISILYRRGSRANTLLVTERCNSLCLMCSQPPRPDDDQWRMSELEALIDLIDHDEPQIGFTGGEPLLLGPKFARLLRQARTKRPQTHLHVLTNGRLFEDRSFAREMCDAGGDQTTWAVPLYGDTAEVHDDIVQAPRAFNETMRGLGWLATFRARVEIRVVLHALSTPRLAQLADLIYRRLPFVEHVALMGIEPMGLARKNKDVLWIDPLDYAERLETAVHHLALRGLNVSIYNLPHCVLPRSLWPYARASISDWKNVADPVCSGCAITTACAGFFRSMNASWRSRGIRPIAKEEMPV